MTDVVWSHRSLRDLEAIRSYIDQFAPLAAERLASRLTAAVESLIDNPERGRPVSNGVRELVVIRPYLIRYQVTPDTVQIIRIRHGARVHR